VFYLSLAFVVALSITLALTPEASAQVSNPRLSVFAGASLLGSENTFVLGNDVTRTGFNNGGKLGFRGTVDFGTHWAGEVMYAFETNNMRISSALRPQERDFGVHVHQFTGNAMYFLTSRESSFRPFGTVGIGLSRFNVTTDAITMAGQSFLNQPTVLTGDTKIALNAGVGVEAKPWTKYGLRFDLRDYMSGTPHFGLPEAPASPGAPFFPVSGVLHRVEVSGSFVWYPGQ